MKVKGTELTDRRAAAQNAKAMLLEKAKARLNDPEAEARRAERAAVAAAREEREAAKREEKRAQAEAQRIELEAQKALEAEMAEKAKATSRDKLIAEAMQHEAERKAIRDARYAARQARKK